MIEKELDGDSNTSVTATPADPNVFDLLDSIVRALEQEGQIIIARHIRAGFARGTGGVDRDYIAKVIAEGVTAPSCPLTDKVKDILHQSRSPDYILPSYMPEPEPYCNFFGRTKPTIITPELERWAGAVARLLLIEYLEALLKIEA